MNTNEIVKEALSKLWPYPDLGHMTATDVNKRENCNEMAILVAITEATAQLQKELEELAELIEWSKAKEAEKPTEQCTTCKLWTDPANVESGTCIWCISKVLKAENERLNDQLSNAKAGENYYNLVSNINDTTRSRGFIKGQSDERVIAMAQALDTAKSQLSTARENALRKAIAKIEWRIKVLSALGHEQTYETAIHELRQRIEDIQSLIATPASECEKPQACVWAQDDNGAWVTGCGNIFELNDGTPVENGMKFCAFCPRPIAQRPIAQVNGVVEREKSKAVATCGKCYHGIPFDQSCAECNAVIHPMQTDRNPRGA